MKQKIQKKVNKMKLIFLTFGLANLAHSAKLLGPDLVVPVSKHDTPYGILDCEMLYGSEGQKVECKPGWFAAGACSSGKRADCKDAVLGKKYFTNLKCCPHKFNSDPEHDCIAKHKKYGINVECPFRHS